jgi:Protein of unknown function (DUF2716)
MRFHELKAPRTPTERQQVHDHWREFGWSEIPSEDELAIEAAWKSKLEPAGILTIPQPSRTWRRLPVLSEEIESELTLSILAAFRRCTRPDERLLAIDWLHTCYYFNPHGGISEATRDQWAMPILPDGDSNSFVAPDFRFGSIPGWRSSGPFRIFGADLLSAFDLDPPRRFLLACGPGVANRP